MENSNSFIDPRRGRLLFPSTARSPLPPLLPPDPPPRYSYEMSLNVSYAPTSFQNKQWSPQPSIDSVGCKRISPWPLPPDGSRAVTGRGSLGTGRDGAAAARLSPAAARGAPQPRGEDGAQLPGSRLLGGSSGGTFGQEEGARGSRRGQRGRHQAEPQGPGAGLVAAGTPGVAAGPPEPPEPPPPVSLPRRKAAQGRRGESGGGGRGAGGAAGSRALEEVP